MSRPGLIRQSAPEVSHDPRAPRFCPTPDPGWLHRQFLVGGAIAAALSLEAPAVRVGRLSRHSFVDVMDIIREASVEMCVRLAAMLGYHGRNNHPRSPEDVIDNRELASDLESILTLAKMLDCDSTIDEIGRELPTVRQATITDKTRAEICDSVFRRFAYDLALPLFLRVPRIRAERAFQRSRRFGDGKVLERWPELV